MSIPVKRMDIRFLPDPRRIITRFFHFGDEERIQRTLSRLLALDDAESHAILTQVLKDYASRHRNIANVFLRHFSHLTDTILRMDIQLEDISEQKKLLIE